MANNSKIVFFGETFMDLTADSVTPETLLEGATAHNAQGDPITGTCTFDADTSDATILVAEMLEGRTAYARGTKIEGTMPNRGSQSDTIKQKTEVKIIQQGYHDGSGTIKLSDTESAKIIPTNIRDGVTILGVTGTLEAGQECKATSVDATPSKDAQTILPPTGYTHITQVNLSAIPVTRTMNSAGGYTITIG